MTTIHDLGWWDRALMVGLPGAGLFGWLAGIYLATALRAVQIGQGIWFTRRLTAFPTQVRIAYFALLIIGLRGPLQFIRWMQLAGTTARVDG